MASIESRRAADGTVSHRVKIRLKGHPPETASFSRLTDARRWEQSTEAAIREGRYFKTAEAKRHTLSDLIDRYIQEELSRKPNNARNITQHLNWWKRELGDYTLFDITPARITDCKTKLLMAKTRSGEFRTNATVVRYMASLSHAFTLAMKDWGWIDDSPMRKVSKPKPARGRERFLSEDERDRLLKTCKQSSSQFLYPVVVLALSTGMRRGEIMSIKWSQVDFDRHRILLYETKNGSSRAVPLAGRALTLIQSLSKVRRIGSDLVFYGQDPKKPVDLKKPWTTAIKKAGIADFRFHDLRHSAASYLAMNGATTIEIAAILGHKTLQMVKRYSHLANSHTAAVVSSMNDKIFGEVKHAVS